eukprot:TRINITY_DN6022_c0_g1_i1.p1 TRINITY_DN6022_c0_g1~~TRINITY_DN6022_c0_g1_i1.p1  ORF type:complete len:443 (+),score=92.75 TRINITY_DN6022_c0_g1_i1:52-1380(+)
MLEENVTQIVETIQLNEQNAEAVNTLIATHVQTVPMQNPMQYSSLQGENTSAMVDYAEQPTENLMETEEIAPTLQESLLYYQFDGLKPCFSAIHEFKELGHQNNFLKGGKWSPDGLCLLTNSDDNYLRLFELPNTWNSLEVEENPSEMRSVLKVKEGETIYDFCWFPSMNSMDPSTCFFLSSSRDHPVHLWDAFNGSLKSSYIGYSHVCELEAAISLSFNANGSHIYCGYDSHIKVFDTETCNSLDLRAKNKKNRKQRGIFGALSFHSNYFAIGSYGGTVGLYDERDPSQLIDMMETKDYGKGVTQVQFSPDGNFLFAGMRRSNSIVGWDIRNTVGPMYQLTRTVETNQKYTFDICVDTNACYLLTPSLNELLIYNLTDSGKLVRSIPLPSINGSVFHPRYPLIATTHGERLPIVPSGQEGENTSNEKMSILKVPISTEYKS